MKNSKTFMLTAEEEITHLMSVELLDEICYETIQELNK